MRNDRAPANVAKDAWERTLTDLDQLATELEADGWTTLAIPAGVASLKTPNIGDSDRFGFIHVVPGNYADEFTNHFADCTFTAYDVFRNELEREVYFVTVLYDTDTQKAVLVAAAYRKAAEKRLWDVAQEHDTVYTHLQRLDGTHLCSIKHEEFDKFFGAGD